MYRADINLVSSVSSHRDNHVPKAHSIKTCPCFSNAGDWPHEYKPFPPKPTGTSCEVHPSRYVASVAWVYTFGNLRPLMYTRGKEKRSNPIGCFVVSCILVLGAYGPEGSGRSIFVSTTMAGPKRDSAGLCCVDLVGIR